MEPDVPIIDIRGLHAGYGDLSILNGVDLQIREGEYICIVGANGAGKSTLLRTIFGLTTITGGEIRSEGSRLSGLSSGEILSAGISYVPQGRCNFPLMTVAENLEMGGYRRRDRAALARDIARVYDLFPRLQERKRERASSLSGGEQQVLELGMALVRRPRVLLIDEPTMGLSPQAIGWVFEEIARCHAERMTIVLVEQNTRKGVAEAERVVVMRLGRVLWDGPADDVDHDRLGEMFLGTADHMDPGDSRARARDEGLRRGQTE